MNPFDQAARYAVQLDGPGFLGWSFPEVLVGWRWAGWLDTQSLSFPRESERRPDTVAALDRRAGDGPPLAVVIELQSRPRADMLVRLVDYVLRLHREKPAQVQPRVSYEVVGLLLNLTGSEQPDTWRMQPAGLSGVSLQFQARVRTLHQEQAADLLQQIASGQISRCVLPWLPLLQGGDQPAIVQEWKRLAELETDARKRGDYAGLAQVFAELAGSAEVWSRSLEGWNVEVSQVVQGWQAKARAEGEARGRAEGEARGRAEGEARGRAEALRSNLLQVVRLHLKVEPPPEMLAAVQAQSDLDILSRWFEHALLATSLDELRQALGLS